MTQDEIIEMGQKAGLAAFIYPHLISESEWKQLSCFIELVAAKEREACARVCETFEIPDKVLGAHPDYLEGKHMAVFQCAAAIRARGEQA